MQAEVILKQLGELWKNLAEPSHGPSTESGVLRACAMTLIVAAEDSADAIAAGEVLAELMHEHPSRAIVLKPSETGEMDARVFAQCWMPFGRRQQICCEQIEISAAPERMGDVPPLMLGLLAPDLPVVLWCRGERWLGQPHFEQLLPLVGKLIVDSTRFADPRKAFEYAGVLRQRGRRVADLTWARLTGWREIIAQTFDIPAVLAIAGDIKEIQIGHAGEKPTPSVFYLAAWLQRALPSAEIRLASVPGEGTGVRTVNLGELDFRSGEGLTILVTTSAGVHTSVLPICGDYAAMREELSITRPDSIFEEVFPIAAKLIQNS